MPIRGYVDYSFAYGYFVSPRLRAKVTEPWHASIILANIVKFYVFLILHIFLTIELKFIVRILISLCFSTAKHLHLLLI